MTAIGWELIRAEVLRRIRAREWLPGAGIPNEEQLAREFGCARATMNRALRELAAAGVLERRRKAGTRVALHPVRKASFDIPVTRAEIEGRGQRYSFEVLREDLAPPPPGIAARLKWPPGAPLLHLSTLHRADGAPFLYEDRWLNLSVLPDIPRDFRQVSANEWLVWNMPYSYGDICFSAEPATDVEARVLGVAPGAALFVTERMTWVAEAPITSVRLAYAPGFRLQTVL